MKTKILKLSSLAIAPLALPFTLEHVAVGDAVVVRTTGTIALRVWRNYLPRRSF